MNFSVIIPTYNAASYLEKLLPAIEKQVLPFELFIIDSSSSDQTTLLLEPYAKTIVTIPQSQFDHGGTRSKIAQIATGDILIFITQDALPTDDDTFKTLVDAFDNPNIAVAYGRQLAYDNTNLFGKHLRMFNYPDTSNIRCIEDKDTYGMKTAFLSDSFAAYRKSAMQEVAYFKDGLIVGEDNYIGAKLLLQGYCIAYVAEAKVYHSHSYSPIQEFQRYFDIGVFHAKEHWILQTFGKAEGEGMKYIKSEFSYLIKHAAYIKIPEFFIRNGLKWMGYKLGKNYKLFPILFIRKLSMHYKWWQDIQ
jgi:rhamnosyltransferase